MLPTFNAPLPLARVKGLTRLNRQTVICRVNSNESDSPLENLTLTGVRSLGAVCTRQHTLQASHGVSKTASPSTPFIHPLPTTPNLRQVLYSSTPCQRGESVRLRRFDDLDGLP